MLSNFQRVLLGVILFSAVPGVGEAQEASVSLFGIAIGSELKTNKDYLFVQENTDTLYYSRRRTTNPEFLLQGVSITPRSHLVVKIDGRTATGPISVCQRMLSETRTQLKSRYPQLKERIDDVNGTDFHLLSMDRLGCFTNENVNGMPLRVPCASSFLLHCERLSNAFIIEAADTEYEKLARDEARAIAHMPKRNHLD